MYFKTEWADQFERERTEPWPFNRLGGAGQVEVEMMQRTLTLGHWSDPGLGIAAVEIPYKAMSMLILLADEGRLGSVHTALGEGLLQRVVSGLSRVRIDLGLPKFKLRESLQLRQLLSDMGLAPAFDPERADFSGITDHPDGFFVYEVIHEARVEVDEEGTEAAAATAIMGDLLGLLKPEPDPIPFIVDRPFIFLIRDQDSGTILFMGRVTDPS